MTPKERMLTALNRGVPDRVPATVHQWQSYHLNRYLGGCSDLEAFQRFGLDASLTRFPVLPSEDSDWRVELRPMEAPEGETRCELIIHSSAGVLKNLRGSNAITSWNITHLVKRPEDLAVIEKWPVPRLDHAKLSQEYDLLGDDGIMRGFVWGDQGGCWQHAACLVGTTELILWACDQPGLVKQLLDILWKKKAQFIEENLPGAKYDLIETGGGAASSTVISPKLFREFCLPYDRKMHDALHQHGFKSVYHTCGGMMPILDLIVENGCDASETLTPPAMGGDARPAELKARIGDKVALIGGLDQNGSLEKGTPEQIRAHIREMFEAYGSGGGYLMSPSDHFFHVSPASLEAYARAAAECVYI